MAIIFIMCAIAIPLTQPVMAQYRLQAAVSAITGAIQGTRYQAIMVGCPFQVALTQGTTTYQILTQALSGTPPACAATFTDTGGAIPWDTSGTDSISASTTLQFSPNGTVSAAAGALTFTVSNGTSTKLITVSGVGSVKVVDQ